jgi:starch synthase
MKVAILPWGNVIEDFLDSINLSIESFCDDMTGGWLFGYIEALNQVGVHTVLICVSDCVQKKTHYIHKPSGTTVIVLPALRIYRFVKRLVEPTRTNNRDISAWKRLYYRFLQPLVHIEPYLATPPFLLKQVLEEERCNAVLCQEYEYPRFDVCVAVSKLLNLPVYASFQGGDFQSSRIEAWIRPRTLAACGGLIVATQTEIQRLKSVYNFRPEKVAKIFNPLDLNLWKVAESPEIRQQIHSQVRSELGITQISRIVIYHGRIDIYRKGLDILLEAWNKVVSNYTLEQRPYLLIVGTGQDAEDFQQMIDNDSLANIIWINQYILDRNVIVRYLSASDLYVLPSRHEGFPVAPLEAMACGLPVVASEAPGVPDILERYEESGGIRVPSEDADQLALAVRKLLDSEALRSRLSQYAIDRVRKHFSLRSVGQHMKEFMR